MVENLKKRHFDAVYCKNKEEALEKALLWIPEGATVVEGDGTEFEPYTEE